MAIEPIRITRDKGSKRFIIQKDKFRLMKIHIHIRKMGLIH